MIAGVNYVGARGAGRLQAITTGGKILLSACFIVAGLRVPIPPTASRYLSRMPRVLSGRSDFRRHDCPFLVFRIQRNLPDYWGALS
jgi:amino acid transporter